MIIKKFKHYFRSNIRPFSFIGEILLAFILLDGVNVLFFPENPGFLKWPYHPYWIIILVFSSRYGLFAGLISGAASSLHCLYFELDGAFSLLRIEQIAETHGIWLPILFFVTGIVLGNIRQRHILLDIENTDKIAKMKKEARQLKDLAQVSEKARKVLEARIVGEARTFKTLYRSTQRFRSMEEKDIFEGCLDILVKNFDVRRVSLYLKDGEFFVLKASVGWDQKEKVTGKIPLTKSIMQIPLQMNKRVTVPELLKQDLGSLSDQLGNTLAMFPLHDIDQSPIGIINIERMDFLSYHKANLELMDVIADWTSKALREARALKNMQKQVIKDEVYQIFSYPYFMDSLDEEFVRAKEFCQPLSVGVIKIGNYGFFSEESKKHLLKTVLCVIKGALDPTDKIYHYKFEGMFGILSPSKSKGKLVSALKQIEKKMLQIYGDKNIEGNQVKLTFSVNEFKKGMTASSNLTEGLA